MGKAVWPAHLVFEAVYRGDSIRWWEVFGASLVLLAISALVAAGRRHRYLVVGWLWFLGTLVPMIGLVVQPHLEALADRYAYISFLGLFLMVCWGVADWAKYRHLPRFVLPVTCLAVLAVLSVITHRQIGYWRDSVTLWTHTLQVTPRNWVAELGIGISYQQQGQLEEALPHFYRAAQDRPEDRRRQPGHSRRRASARKPQAGHSVLSEGIGGFGGSSDHHPGMGQPGTCL